MLPINIYPYLDITDLNLDSIIKSIKSLTERLNNFVALNTIKYANPIQWNITTQYEMNTVVVDPVSGTAYLSVAPVPSGVALTNTDYWTPIFTLNLLSANQNITLRDDANNVIATFESDEGDWLIWNYTLYKVTRHIDLAQAYVVGYNLVRYTVEMFIKDYINVLEMKIGNLEDLETEDKDNLVNAINELKSNMIFPYVTPEQFGAVGDGTTDDTQALKDAITYCENRGTILQLIASRYLFSETLSINGVSIIGNNKTLYYSGSGNAIEITSGWTMTLEGFNLNTANGTNGIYSTDPHLNHSTMKNLYITNFTNGIYLENAFMCKLDSVIVEYCSGYGIYLTSAYNAEIVRCVCGKCNIGLYIQSGCGFRISDFTGEGAIVSSIILSYCMAGVIENLYYEDVDNYHTINVIKTELGMQNMTFNGLYMTMADNSKSYIKLDGSAGGYNMKNNFSGIVVDAHTALSQTVFEFLDYSGYPRCYDNVMATPFTDISGNVTFAKGNGKYLLLTKDNELPALYSVDNDVISKITNTTNMIITNETANAGGTVEYYWPSGISRDNIFLLEVRDASNIKVNTYTAQWYSTAITINGLTANANYKIAFVYNV